MPEDMDAADFVAYTGTPFFRTEEEFNLIVETLREKSKYNIPVDVTPADALLALSTCYEDGRLVLVCRRLRENESPEQMRELLQQSVKR